MRNKFSWLIFIVVILVIILLINATRKIGPAKIGPTIPDGAGQNSPRIKDGPEIPDGAGQIESEKQKSDFPSCGNKMDFFTVSPIKSEDYGDLIALGSLNPTGHVFPTDHIYLFSRNTPDNGRPSEALTKPFYSPGDMWITEISTNENISAKITDYSISYQPCAEFRGKFGHVGRLSSKLKSEIEKSENKKCDEYATGGSRFRACRYDQLKIFVKAGEELGTVFNGQSAALDIWATDFRIEKLKFANPDRWREESFYNACPANYFTDSIKNEMLGRFSSRERNGKRTIEPVCGTIEVDIKGTAKGHWFPGDYVKYAHEDKNMALVNDNKNPQVQAFSMGISGENKGYRSGVNFFVPKNSGNVNRDFAEVKSDGNVYCYETSDAWDGRGQKAVLYLNMPNGETIRVEKSNRSACGQGPWSMENYIEFVR